MKISVALCTYNGEKYISQQINSILDQSTPVNEIIICDDNSTDNTVEIIKGIFSQKSFSNYKIEINVPALRTIKNFEKAVSLCTGRWIFLSDQDDVWNYDKVEKLLAAVQKDTLFLFTNGKLIDENGNDMQSDLWHHWGFDVTQREKWKNNELAFDDLLNNKNFATGATVVLNKKLLKNSLPITVPNGYYHDAWFALHAAAGKGLHFLEENTISYRIHPNQQFGISMDGKDLTSVFSTGNISNFDFKHIIKRKFRKKTFISKLASFKNDIMRTLNLKK